MDALKVVFVVLHLLGLLAIVGSVVVRRGVPTPWLVWGARAQIITGLVLVGINEAGDGDVNHTKIGVKLLVALAVAACAEIAAGRERRGQGEPRLVHAAGALAIINALIATLWT
ncbi:hypothetical protein [Knoellia subterranea]|uniref:Membrane protein n=1 Tax=Knoellia subterranea KCTC 19937 TaxID=1385521 RepID=A0A0A0JMQ2_9MICO|nr:hypothetical protein [Knoellia subterranea]KGN37347.1 membrane protein [Knoellia subterranea KCTC 19937]